MTLMGKGGGLMMAATSTWSDSDLIDAALGGAARASGPTWRHVREQEPMHHHESGRFILLADVIADQRREWDGGARGVEDFVHRAESGEWPWSGLQERGIHAAARRFLGLGVLCADLLLGPAWPLRWWTEAGLPRPTETEPWRAEIVIDLAGDRWVGCRPSAVDAEKIVRTLGGSTPP